MTVSSFKKALLPSLLISGGLFSSLTLPLAIFGSQPLVIEVQDEPIFVGKLKDVAAPYVGLATVLSAGAGVAGLAAGAWRQSSRKANNLEDRVSHLQQQLQETEGQLETLKLSESHLHTNGLGAFLNEVNILGQSVPLAEQAPSQAEVDSSTTIQSVQMQQIEEQLSILQKQLQEKEAQLAQLEKIQAAVVPSAPKVQVASNHASQAIANAVVSSGAMIQPHQKRALVPAPEVVSTTAALHALAQVSELQNRLEQIVSHVGHLQNALQAELQPVEEQPTDNSYHALLQLNQRIQKLESIWGSQVLAS
jgi:hypothetical protein